jgi:predicted RNA-binding protein with PIN domain
MSGTDVHDVANEVAPPVPESLLVPLLDDAAKVLREVASRGDAPAPLRAIVGFDPRRLSSGPARQQLRRAFDLDESFRGDVVTRFRARDAVRQALERWAPSAAWEQVIDADERSDLPLLASTLYALRPEGWVFGLGMICAAAARARAEQEQTDDAQAWNVRLATVEEARRRAEAAQEDAFAEAARLERELRDERSARRARETGAQQAVAEADQRRRDAEALTAQADARAELAEARLRRESDRARAAERELRLARRELDARATSDAASAPTLGREDVDALASAADEARRLSGTLERLTRRARDAVPESSPPTVTAPPVVKRTRVPIPPGMLADTTEALDTMIRTRGVVLVVDGYNVSMAGWPDAEPAEQRTRLLGALERLHLRVRCDVVVVFDGADVEGVPEPRRTGVRVVFSAPGEEADPVVVREVAARPKRVPVIVASSDGWVREHAEAEGATVVPNQTLLDLLRQ